MLITRRGTPQEGPNALTLRGAVQRDKQKVHLPLHANDDVIWETLEVAALQG